MPSTDKQGFMNVFWHLCISLALYLLMPALFFFFFLWMQMFCLAMSTKTIYIWTWSRTLLEQAMVIPRNCRISYILQYVNLFAFQFHLHIKIISTLFKVIPWSWANQVLSLLWYENKSFNKLHHFEQICSRNRHS